MFQRKIKTIVDGQKVEVTSKIISRHDRPLPRYTSYPPIPAWNNNVGHREFAQTLRDLGTLRQACPERIARFSSTSSERTGDESKGSGQADGLSLYIHLPFCRKRCHFCACHAIATPKTEVVDLYLKTLKQEIDLVLRHLNPETIKLKLVHWGGGTPTFLNLNQMKSLQDEIKNRFEFSPDIEIGMEIDPWQINIEKIEMARHIGFNRISFGIQDTNPEVLKECGRNLNVEHTAHVMDAARRMGFKGINVDLCYGLPRQNPRNFKNTIRHVIKLNPDRIALFNFAYLPERFPHQRKINESTLPSPFKKVEMFAMAIKHFNNSGYQFLGLDHFAKNNDELTKAKLNGTLRRTFQGYTAQGTHPLVGLGITAISHIEDLYAQNEKKLSAYFRAINNEQLAIHRGHKFTTDDHIRSWVMQKVFCNQLIDKMEFNRKWGVFFDEYFKDINVNHLMDDGLIENTDYQFKILPLGRLFIRNIACAFDKYLSLENSIYSKAI